METTVGELSLLHKGNTHFLDHHWTSFGSVHIVIIDEYGIEIAIPSICKPGDVTYVVISSETERFANEIHTHEARIRSRRELLENSQESPKKRALPTKRGNHEPQGNLGSS